MFSVRKTDLTVRSGPSAAPGEKQSLNGTVRDLTGQPGVRDVTGNSELPVGSGLEEPEGFEGSKLREILLLQRLLETIYPLCSEEGRLAFGLN